MHSDGFRGLIRGLLTLVVVVAFGALVWLTFCRAMVSADFVPDSGWVRDVLYAGYNHHVLLIILAAAQTPLLWIRARVGPKWAWLAIHTLLTAYRDLIFAKSNGEEQHNRVTLFKHKKWCWRRFWSFSGWLVSVRRSGTKTVKPVIVFKAPDDGDSAEGIAGMTWVHPDKSTYVDGLKPPEKGTASYDDDLTEYARATRVSKKLAEGISTRARSFYGIPLKVEGKLWGVVVVDSRDESIAVPKAGFVRLFVDTLSRMISLGGL